MRKIFVSSMLVFVAYAFVLFTAENVLAQTAKRVRFTKGENSTTITGTITKPGSSVKYLLGAKAGQKLTINFEPDSGAAMPAVMVFPPGKSSDKDKILDEGSGGPYEVNLSSSGDFSILVGCVKRCRYSLTITVE